jgi:hypothetical protein
MKKRLVSFALAGSAVAAICFMAADGEAASNSCSAWAEKKTIRFAPDNWRVGGTCSRLEAGMLAKATGVVSFGPDHSTPWFVDINLPRYSAWGKGGIDKLVVSYRYGF